MTLRFQLEQTGVEVIELMPPAVKTDLVADIAGGDGIALMTTGELVKQSGFYRLLAFLMFIAFLKLIFMQMYYVFPTFGIRVALSMI